VVARLSFLLQVVALGLDVVGDECLHRRLGTAVGVCGADGADFWDGNHVLEASGVAVDGGRRRKDNVRDIVAGH